MPELKLNDNHKKQLQAIAGESSTIKREKLAMQLRTEAKRIFALSSDLRKLGFCEDADRYNRYARMLQVGIRMFNKEHKKEDATYQTFPDLDLAMPSCEEAYRGFL